MTTATQGRILCADELLPTPWRNGLGITREIALFPPGAGADDFLWRASVADVVGAAPFSMFPGVDRVITLLDGQGFHMTLDGAHRHALTTPFVPFAFAGEASVTVHLAGGPTRDFNLMLRRGRASGRVEVCHGPERHSCPTDLALLYCARGRIETPCGHLGEGDAWCAGEAHGGTIALAPDAVALMVRVQPAAP